MDKLMIIVSDIIKMLQFITTQLPLKIDKSHMLTWLFFYAWKKVYL